MAIEMSDVSEREHAKGVLKEAEYAELKVYHPVHQCLETKSMAAFQDGRRVLLRKMVKKGYSG